MNLSRVVLHRVSLVPVLLLLLLPLAACGGGPDKDEQAQPGAETPAPTADGQPEGGGRRGGPKGHITLAGSLTFDGDTPLECTTSDKTLNLVFNPNKGEASQVEMKVANYSAPGKYPATFVIREGGTKRTWDGKAQLEIESREMGKKKNRTALNGTVNGDFDGEGGKGTLTANFRRCVLRNPA